MRRPIAALLALLSLTLTFTLSACSEKSANLDDYDLEKYITVGTYRGVKIPNTVITVSDDDVKAAVDDWLDGFAETVTLSESDVIQQGDTVRITYYGYIKGEYDGWEDGEEFTKKTDGYDLKIGSGKFIPGFEDALIGYHPGEEYEFDITFPKDYKNNEKLRDVLTTFKGKIESAKRNVKPEYTESLVVEKTEYKSIEEFEEHIRADLRAEADEKELLAEVSAVWEKVLKESEVIKYPEAVVEAQVAEAKKTYTQYASSMNMTLEDLVKANNMTMASFEASLEPQCKQLVFEEMVLKVIIKREEITISDAEYTEGLAKYAKDNGFKTAKDCEDYYGEETVRESLLWDKVLLFLVEKAEITDEKVEWTDK